MPGYAAEANGWLAIARHPRCEIRREVGGRWTDEVPTGGGKRGRVVARAT